ncbi:epithelial-stromal interaction protein 1 isoform X2 [Motacilla alba alba]|uniref:epithelial-stromal interaction protein 1 isoform X2 n=1 Tax=Motacilla alba alba TaxID=1094192 RepID=UPI0018D588D0|nr:epithelial-stromal interaction protein 1 isoform X2 [Motacilla alba alba]
MEERTQARANYVGATETGEISILDFNSVIFDWQTFRHHGEMRAMKDASSTLLRGNESEARVRQNQQMILMQSKYQKKHKREEYVKAKKAAEEAEILKKKAIQREKAERLEVKKRQEEMQRREMLLEDQKYKTNELLNRLDVGLPKSDSCQIANPGPESTAWKRSHAYKQALREDENSRLEEMRQEQRRKAELLEFKQKQEEEIRTRALKNEQRRVNNAFLDRLQNKTQPNNIYDPGYTGLPQ